MSPELQMNGTNGTVALGTGPPTREEMIVYYPPKFTWDQLRTFINAGDLGLLKRDRALQKRYNTWGAGIKKEYGSLVNYLIQYRLQWGKPDSLSLLPSELSPPPPLKPHGPDQQREWFTADIDPQLISIIRNDWPYSVPHDVEHALIWSKLPIQHDGLTHPSIAARLAQDGIWGFTGTNEPPPSPSTLHLALPALAEWGVTEDKLIRSPPLTEEEQVHHERACAEVQRFVEYYWHGWETCWFVNPPRLQSVPGLAHVHVFARKISKV